MSNFWTTSDNDDATRTGNEFDAGGGNFDPIPEGSVVMAMPEEAKWDTVRDRHEEFVSIKWTVLAPPEYLNRKIFQKLFVTDDDPNVTDAKKMEAKRDKAKRMLAAIDANAGGKLAKSAKKPDDQDLAVALIAKQMLVKLGVWEMNGNSGNWIQWIGAKGSKDIAIGKTVTTSAGATKVGACTPTPAPAFDDDDEDFVPF